MVELSFWNIILTPIYFIFILFIAKRVENSRVVSNPAYSYFTKGLLVKLIGSFSFCMVYSFYYNGGDTIAYFENSRCIVNLFSYHPKVAFSILKGDLSMSNHYFFSEFTTGLPHWYMFRDPTTFSAGRFTVPFTFFGAKTYIPTSFLVCTFSYIGVFKLFKLFTKTYPRYVKEIAICILYIPSFIFWGSGIMKDTYIIGATCWITYSMHAILIERKKTIINVIAFAFNFWLILSLKPYILSALFLGMAFWLNSAYLNKIKSALLRFFAFPFIVFIVALGGLYIFSNIGSVLGDYGNIETAVEKAKITQQDLLRAEQYGSNSYDIGNLDASISGLLKKAPLAIFTAIYRPSLIEIGSVSSLLSVIENTVLLFFTIFILFKTKTKKLITIIRTNPLIQFSLIFSLILAFGVGIATANFGALVRYKIPFIPYYFSALYLIYHLSRENTVNQ